MLLRPPGRAHRTLPRTPFRGRALLRRKMRRLETDFNLYLSRRSRANLTGAPPTPRGGTGNRGLMSLWARLPGRFVAEIFTELLPSVVKSGRLNSLPLSHPAILRRHGHNIFLGKW